jgi:hypothetical protein
MEGVHMKSMIITGVLLCGLLSCAGSQEPGSPANPAAASPKTSPGASAPVVRLTPSDHGLDHPGLWRENMCLADINGDGHVDFVCPPPRSESQKPFIYLGDGKGGWREWTEARFPKLALAYGAVDAGDIDGNGLMDLALGCHQTNMTVLLQTSPGEFAEARDGLPDATRFSTRALKLRDVNGDGRPEIIAVNETAVFPDGLKFNPNRQKVFTFRDGLWSPLPILPLSPTPQAFGDSLAVADFNGDGRPDFVSASNVYAIKQILFLNQNDGFRAQDIAAIPDGSYIFQVAAADFDRDGRMDIVCTMVTFDFSEGARKDKVKSMRSRLGFLVNRGDAWEFHELAGSDEGKAKHKYSGLTTADFNGDGLPDVAAAFDDGSLILFLNKGGMQFVRAQTPGWVVQGKVSWFGSADFNEDGTPDLAVAFGAEQQHGHLAAYTISLK